MKNLLGEKSQEHLTIVITGMIVTGADTCSDDEEAQHRRWRSIAFTIVATGLLTITFLTMCWTIFLDKNADPDRRELAGMIAMLIGALAGFLGGRAAK